MPMTDGPPPLSPVSTTAVGVAAVRAAESAQTDPLFVDPLAPAFVRAAQAFWSVDRDDRDDHEDHDRRRVGALIFWIRVRTRFLDDVVTRACADGCRQFVVLGAGLDARAFRLPFPADARCFEVDLPPVLTFKEQVVRDGGFAPACERVVVPADLAGPWPAELERAGFDPARRTTWLAEGLLAYLTEATREAVIDDVTARSVPGSHFGVTVATVDRRVESARDPDGLPTRPGDYVALWQSDPPPDAHTWLGDRGWSVAQHDALERGAAYGIEIPVPRGQRDRDRARLVDATRM
jgi:methyltransferase (TIGR00027 family)